MKILAVDDDPSAMLVLQALLKSLGHEVATATSGDAAFAALRDQSARVIVSDWRMAGGDGLELCRRVRELTGDYVYFILLTQYEASEDHQRQAMEAGVDDFLSKPVRPAELRMRLHVAERILGYTRQVQHLESILPVCSYCHKVRSDKNYWDTVEKYLQSRTGARVSHGICPDCMESIVRPQMRELGIMDDPLGNGEDSATPTEPNSGT